MMLSYERARELLNYDPITGKLTWRIKFARKIVVGREAGSVNRDGHIDIRVDGKLYRAHRICWMLHYGVWPGMVDHKDLDGTNNAIENLRLADKSTNGANRRKPSNNKSGAKGVHFHKGAQKWMASVGGRYIGLFPTVAEAAAAYNVEAEKTYGEYARAA